MKTLIRLTVLILLFAFLLPVAAFATDSGEEAASIIYLDDGSYFVVEIEEVSARTTYSKSGTKYYTYYDSDDVAQWKISLTASYTYNGTSATCTSTSTSYTIYVTSMWDFGSKSSSKSGNTATGNFVMLLNLIGSSTLEFSRTITLTCDKNGNLS